MADTTPTRDIWKLARVTMLFGEAGEQSLVGTDLIIQEQARFVGMIGARDSKVCLLETSRMTPLASERMIE